MYADGTYSDLTYSGNSGAAVGTVLHIDALVRAERSANSLISQSVGSERLANFLIMAPTLLEFEQGVQINQLMSQERSSTVREDFVLYALPTAVVVTILDQVFQEWLAKPVNDEQVAAEWSSLLRADQTMPLEYVFQTIRLDVLASLEWLESSLSIASRIDAEWLSRLFTDGLTPVEWRPRFTYPVVTEGVRVIATVRSVQVEPTVRNVQLSITKRGVKVV
jgi:hypothetical protein